MPLESLADVKIALGIAVSDDDALLGQLQAQADSYVETFCGRKFSPATFTEYHPGGARILFLMNYPVAELSSIRVDANGEFEADTTMPADRYRLFGQRGVVECLDESFVPRLSGWQIPSDAYPNAVRVIYSTTGITLPPAAARAYSELIGFWLRQVKTSNATGQLNVIQTPGLNGPTIYPWNQSLGYRIPEGVKELLRPFRVPAL